MVNLSVSSLALAAALASQTSAFSVPSSLTKSLTFGLTTKVHRNPAYSDPSSNLYSSLSDDKQQDEVASNDDFVSAIFEPNSKILGEAIKYEKLTIGVTKETFPGENRVSLSPASVELLVKAGFHVVVQSGGKSISQYFYLSSIWHFSRSISFIHCNYICRLPIG